MGQHCDSGELLEDIQYCIEGRTDEKEIKTEPNFKKFELQQKSVQLKKLDDDDDDEDDNENENDKKYDENNNFRGNLEEDNNMKINDNYATDVKQPQNDYS